MRLPARLLTVVQVEAKLKRLGLVLPGPVRAPEGARLPFAFARFDGRHVYLSGHGPQAPDVAEQPSVINGFSDLILELYGPEAGQHARSAVGMAELPFGISVEIEAEVEIR